MKKILENSRETRLSQVTAPLALVTNLTTRWRHLYQFQFWPPGNVTYVATLPWIALLALSVSIESVSVPCESLVSREFSRIFFQFHFSISISGHFHFTFHSRSRFQGIFISLFTLEMSERKNKFTFHFSKRVKAFQISLFFSRKKSELCMSCHEKFKKIDHV